MKKHGNTWPHLYDPPFIEENYAWFPKRMTDTKKVVWLKKYYSLVEWNPFVDGYEYKDEYATSQCKKTLQKILKSGF